MPPEVQLLQSKWNALFFNNPSIQELSNIFFVNLLKKYNDPKRHYHNLNHIRMMLALSEQYATHLQQPDVVQLAIFYHDIIYNPLRKDNEARSAQRAARELKQLQVSTEQIEAVKKYILATQQHDLQEFGTNSDLAYFLDFDLAILGADWETYFTYTQNIRKEYHIYPDIMYRSGRAKVLEHFLNKPTIYFTDFFQQEKEAHARQNVQQEWQRLQHQNG